MKVINSNKCLLFKDGDLFIDYTIPDTQIEINGMLIIDGISPLDSLPKAFSTYFGVEPKVDKVFFKLDCSWCHKVTIYNDRKDFPIAFGAQGHLVCSHCQGPWLYYEYEER